MLRQHKDGHRPEHYALVKVDIQLCLPGLIRRVAGLCFMSQKQGVHDAQ
jgi:hypothetical protein